MEERVNPVQGYELDGDRPVPVRQEMLHKIINDRCAYTAQKPPCQALPYVLATAGAQICVEAGAGEDAMVTVTSQQILAFLRDGYYVWMVDDLEPRVPPGSTRLAFKACITASPVAYNPRHVKPIKDGPELLRQTKKGKSMLMWKRNRTRPWVPRVEL